MNELEPKQRPIEIIESEINFYKTQTATGIIEIGKRLIEAKSQLPHGEWGKWLEDKVEFSQDTARNFMRVAESFPNPETIRNLPISKVYALLDVPQCDRDDFIQNTPVEDMTTRELQKAIKRAKELEQMLEIEKGKPPKVVKEAVEVEPSDYRMLKNRIEIRDQEIESLTRQKEALELKANRTEADAENYQKLKQQIEFLSNQKSDLARQIESATELSGLAVRIDNLLKNELAPVRYSRVFERMDSEVARENLFEIIEAVEGWCYEIRQMIPAQYRKVTVVK